MQQLRPYPFQLAVSDGALCIREPSFLEAKLLLLQDFAVARGEHFAASG